jgi:hypothetical protein
MPPGLSWSWEMDFAALLDVLGDQAVTGDGIEDQDEVLDQIERTGGEPVPAGVYAVRVAERLGPGPDLVAWLAAAAPAAELSAYDAVGAASSWRRIVSWAQANELAAVARIASCAAARDENIGTGEDGRPVRVPAGAAAEVSLALTMSHYSACVWTDLAVDLRWRLAATGEALAAGQIDLPRARLIAEATRLLTDEAARAVQERVLPAAGTQTTGMLRDALRRAVIAVDPEGAEQRKKEAERRAKVSVYPDEDGTATLTAQGMPVISAAAGMTRITAMARAMQAAGYSGGIDFLRTQVLAGLILGTLPLIPPATGAPPDDEPTAPDDPGGSPGPGSPGPGAPGRGGPGRGDGHGDAPGSGPGSGPGAPGTGPEGRSGTGPATGEGPWDGFPDPADEDAPSDDPIADTPLLTGTYNPDRSYRPRNGPPGEAYTGPHDYADAAGAGTGPLPRWPALPTVIPPSLSAPDHGMSRPVPGLLDVTVPWQTLTGISTEPGYLGRIGPITATDTRHLADCADRDPAAIWRIIVTNHAGQALAVTRLPRTRARPPAGQGEPPGPSPGDGNGLVGRITLTIAEDTLNREWAPLLGPDPPPILLQALRHASKALARARAIAEADAAAGGCAHLDESLAYRVPPRLRDYITARDLTCRSPTCRQPVWCCDIDHTVPYDQGGRTCKCNNGGVCRTHHQIKALPGWTLRQTAPGTFEWTTPGGRTYTATPDTHPL